MTAVSREVRANGRTFASGLLVEVASALQQMSPGELLALVAAPDVETDLRAWSALTKHAIVEQTPGSDGLVRFVIRFGPAGGQADDVVPALGQRVWVYTNFDCNLSCDYCCVRSSPRAPRRELGVSRIRQIAEEARPLGVRAFFVTGGEPFILPDLGDMVRALADVAPVTLLTNGMLFKGSRLATLEGLPRDRVTLQISLDSATPAQHDRRRGAGSWQAAWDGIQLARSKGFRVRLAATVSTDVEETEFVHFLDAEHIAADDRVVRRVAHRGVAMGGVAVARADLVPEITITDRGVFWHPVGAEDEDLLVTREIFPLARAFALARAAFAESQEHGARMARVFHCA